MAPGCRDSENSCSSHSLELVLCLYWFATHLLPEASMQGEPWWPVVSLGSLLRVSLYLALSPRSSTTHWFGDLGKSFPSPSLSFIICKTEAVRMKWNELMWDLVPCTQKFLLQGSLELVQVAVTMMKSPRSTGQESPVD